MTNYTLGIDVSVWQDAQINWTQAISQGVRFAFVRGAYGVTKDARFDLHWGSSKGKLYRGVYLYYRDGQDPVQQAQALYDLCLANGGLGELPPVVDVEGINNPTLTASKIRQCVEKVYELFGDVMLYTGFYVWRDAVTGDKTWAGQYKLWLAGYPFTGWDHPQDLERVKLYPPLVPYPWTHFDVWQFTSRLPANVYGVSGTYLDGNYCTEAFAAQYLNPTPPPDPIPQQEPLMLFTNNTSKLEIRSSANKIINPSNDVGDLPKDSEIIALEVRATDSNSVWVRFIPDPAWVTKTVPEYWAAMVHDGQGPLLKWVAPPPVTPLPTIKLQATKAPTNLYYWNEKNGAGYPIMKLPPVGQRCQFAEGAQIIANPVIVNADGTVDYYEVYNTHLANPTFPVPAGYTGWFVSENDVFEVTS